MSGPCQSLRNIEGYRPHVCAALWVILALAAMGGGVAATAGESDSGIPVRYESCAGWGLCIFRIIPTAAPPGDNSAAIPGVAPRASSLGQRVSVRLRGVGDESLVGTCTPEREAARTIREFIEGILRRADRITLHRPIPHRGGVLLATVRVDGTDVVDILVHIGHGRRGGMAPDAAWCD